MAETTWRPSTSPWRAPAPRAPTPLPYARHSITEGDVAAVARSLLSGWLTQGPEIERFETALAEVCGTAHAVAVSSGTAALHVALLGLGVGPGDEVIVPSLTFLATANAVAWCGARPVFADVDPETLTLDPHEVARRTGPRTRGVVPMHYAGLPADVDAVRRAVGPGRFVLEDACHALGATQNDRPAGSLGHAACFSFHPAKHVTTGEGGAITTDSVRLAARARALRTHGVARDPRAFRGLGLPESLAAEERGAWVYEMHDSAPNYRLPDFAAALGCSQLERLPRFQARRGALAAAYREGLGDLESIELPGERAGSRSAWHLYPVRVRPERLAVGRAEIFAALREHGLGVQVHFIPVHLQPYYREHFGTKFGDLPVSEDAYLRSISLPMFPAMTDADVARVIETLRGVLRRFAR